MGLTINALPHTFVLSDKLLVVSVTRLIRRWMTRRSSPCGASPEPNSRADTQFYAPGASKILSPHDIQSQRNYAIHTLGVKHACSISESPWLLRRCVHSRQMWSSA